MWHSTDISLAAKYLFLAEYPAIISSNGASASEDKYGDECMGL
jgi:hypothetical protein